VNGTTRFASSGMFFTSVAVLACWLSAFPTVANAQGIQGQNAVYNSSNGVVGSNAFIDASMFPAAGRDFCGVLKFVLQNIDQPPTYPSGAVIDARGLPGNTGTSMTCAASPWAGITNPPFSTILLPAGTIVISTTWVLPSNTRLVGEGENNPLSSTPGTTIQTPSGTLLSTMIQFGSSLVCSSGVCSGISVERLTLDGQAQAVHGIVNQFSQTNTYAGGPLKPSFGLSGAVPLLDRIPGPGAPR